MIQIYTPDFNVNAVMSLLGGVETDLVRARLHGTRSGRPIGGQRIPAKKEREIAAALLKGDRGMQKIARELSVGVSVVQRVKASLNGKAR